MKVLHVIPSVGPKRGGPSVAAPAMCRALASYGVACDLVATNDDGNGILKVPVGEWTTHAGARMLFFRRRGNALPAIREFQIGAGFAGWFSSNGRNYDLIHVHALFSYLSTMAMCLARRAEIPYVLRPLGQLETYSLRRRALKKQLFLRLWDGANIRGAAAIHLTSQRELDVSWIPGPAARWVVPLGVNLPPASAAPGPEPRPPQILFLSRWHAKKRIGILIEALAMLKDQPWHLTLAGAGDSGPAKTIMDDLDRAGIAERTSLPGFLAGEAKSSALRAADLFVLPSASENFGIAVAEALAAGVPVVITRHVALAPEVEAAAAGWICGDSSAELTAALRSALRDPDERRQRGENARKLAEESFSWESAACKLASLYRTVLK